MLTYPKTKSGDWAVFGPIAELREGPVVVTKKDGSTKQERVLKVSKSFDVNGVPHAYGFLVSVDVTKAPACPICKGKMLPSKFASGKYYCPKKECREKKEEEAALTRGRCYMCGSPYCDGASGGLCEHD